MTNPNPNPNPNPNHTSNFNSTNLGVVVSILVFLIGILFFIVVLLHADTGPPNVVASSICPKTRNSSLCRSVLKPAGSTDALILAIYTVNLARTNAGEVLGHARRLAAATVDPRLKKRYLECSQRLEFVVARMNKAKKSFAVGGYVMVFQTSSAAVADADECLNSFKKPPPELSALPTKVKNLGDMCDVAVSLSNILAGDDY